MLTRQPKAPRPWNSECFHETAHGHLRPFEFLTITREKRHSV